MGIKSKITIPDEFKDEKLDPVKVEKFKQVMTALLSVKKAEIFRDVLSEKVKGRRIEITAEKKRKVKPFLGDEYRRGTP